MQPEDSLDRRIEQQWEKIRQLEERIRVEMEERIKALKAAPVPVPAPPERVNGSHVVEVVQNRYIDGKDVFWLVRVYAN